MAQFPALPLFTDAYLGDTTHLTTIEHGAYLLLLITMWRNKCILPNDDKLLARYARLTPAQWARVKPVLWPFFDVSEDTISQARLTDEAYYVKRKSKQSSDAANARWLKNNEKDNAGALPDRCPPPHPTSISEPIGSSKKKGSPKNRIVSWSQVSPADPVLNRPDDPLAEYAQVELDRMTVLYDLVEDIDDRIIGLLQWCDGKDIVDPNQRKRLVARKLQERQDELAATRALKSTEAAPVSSEAINAIMRKAVAR